MDTLDAIFTRKSVRNFTDRPISRENLETILRAGTSGPSCVNARDWRFVAVTDRETLLKMAEANGRAADPLKGAAAGILILGDLDRAFPPAKDYWVIDGAIAGQNMVLTAHALGIGSVWLKKKDASPLWKTALVVWIVMICLSVMFVKQHSALDILAALPVCVLAELLLYWKSYWKPRLTGRIS